MTTDDIKKLLPELREKAARAEENQSPDDWHEWDEYYAAAKPSVLLPLLAAYEEALKEIARKDEALGRILDADQRYRDDNPNFSPDPITDACDAARAAREPRT